MRGPTRLARADFSLKEHTDIHCLHNIHTLRYSTSFRHRLCPQGHLLAPLKFFNPSLSPIASPYARPFDYSLPRLHQVSSLTHTALSHRALPLRPATRIAPPHSPGATRPALLPSATSHVTARTRTSLTSSRAPCHDVCSSLSRPALRRRATFSSLRSNITYHGQDSDLIGQPRAPCMMSASASLTLHGELRLQPERIFHPARHLLPATSRVAARTRHCPVPAHQPCSGPAARIVTCHGQDSAPSSPRTPAHDDCSVPRDMSCRSLPTLRSRAQSQ